ncbi:paralemmin-3 [Pelodytes ibericus]
MEETRIYNQRLHGITEKRRILTQMESVQRDLEQERLRLQQLKRKSLRDRWLMEGLATAPEAEMENPLTQAEGKIHELEQEFESLQSQLLHLENPDGNRKSEGIKVTPASQVQLVNGERGPHSENSSVTTKMEVPLVDGHSEVNRASWHPVPAVRVRKPETPAKGQDQEAQVKEGQGFGNQGVEYLNQPSAHLGQDDDHQLQTQDFRLMGKVNENFDQTLSSQSNNHSHDLQNDVAVPEEGAQPVVSDSQEEEQLPALAPVQNQTREPGAATEHKEHIPVAMHDNEEPVPISKDEVHDQSYGALTIDHYGDETSPSNENEKEDQNQEISVDVDQNQEHSSVIQDPNPKRQSLNQELNSTTKDQNKELSLVTQEHPVEPISKISDQNQEATSTNQDQNQNPIVIPKDQPQGHLSENRDQESIPAALDQETISTTNDQKQEPMSQTQDQNQEPILTHDQSSSTAPMFNNQKQDQGLTLPVQEQNKYQDHKPTPVLPSNNQTQVHVSHVVVVPNPGLNPSPSEPGQNTISNEQVSSGAFRPTEEVQPLLNRSQETNANSPHRANTAESRKEKGRVKEKTCHCCVMM